MPPWDLLPVELVLEIFTRCLPSQGLAPLALDEPPLLLVHVCHSWCEIAMSTPQLWASILVSPSRHKISRAMVERWIQASGTGPLDIGLHMVDDDDRSFFGPILALHHRWRVLDMELSDTALLIEAEGPSPSLETLIVRPYGGNVSSLYKFSPNVTTVKWRTAFDLDLLFSPLRRQLTHLEIHDTIVPSSLCRHLMRACASLEAFHVKVLDTEDNPKTLIHPQLRSLDLHSPSGAYLFVRSLMLPKLERLSYNMGFYRLNAIQTSQLVAFLARSGDTLQSLTLCDAYVESGEAAFLLDALPHLPHLRELSILPSGSFDARSSAFSAFHLSDALFAALAAGLLPHLQHLVFHSCVGFTDTAFVDMVCARWRAVPRLRTVDVGLDHAVEAAQLERLRACRGAGLDFPHWGVLAAGPRASHVRREVVLVSA
ncbi:hypothetical protein DFH09DRAFT_1138153 [Mycena vulgaris]|nr:hypothetical protein DFH09DRAFT_1138153 [Mycena vulgaris]